MSAELRGEPTAQSPKPKAQSPKPKALSLSCHLPLNAGTHNRSRGIK
jgi:hypothetical protein